MRFLKFIAPSFSKILYGAIFSVIFFLFFYNYFTGIRLLSYKPGRTFLQSDFLWVIIGLLSAYILACIINYLVKRFRKSGDINIPQDVYYDNKRRFSYVRSKTMVQSFLFLLLLLFFVSVYYKGFNTFVKEILGLQNESWIISVIFILCIILLYLVIIFVMCLLKNKWRRLLFLLPIVFIPGLIFNMTKTCSGSGGMVSCTGVRFVVFLFFTSIMFLFIVFVFYAPYNLLRKIDKNRPQQ